MITDRKDLPAEAREMARPDYQGRGVLSNAEANLAFPELAVAPDRTGRTARSASKEGKRMTMKVHELILRMNKIGWKKAVVVNLNVFPLTVDLGYCGRKTVRGVKKGEPFNKFIIENYVIMPREGAEGDRIPEATLPVEIAGEFTRNYKLTELSLSAPAEVGVGVFWFEYDERMPNEMPEELYELASNLRFEFYKQQFEEAENLWATNKNRREISDHMREAVRVLKEAGVIEVSPEWFVSTKDQKAPAKVQTCPACASEAPAAAIFCLTCETMFDAEKVKLIRPDIYFKQRPMEAKAVGVQAGSMNVAGLKPLPKGE